MLFPTPIPLNSFPKGNHYHYNVVFDISIKYVLLVWPTGHDTPFYLTLHREHLLSSHHGMPVHDPEGQSLDKYVSYSKTGAVAATEHNHSIDLS